MAKLFTVKQTAKILGFSTNTVYKYLNEGVVKGVRSGNRGRFRITKTSLEEYLGTKLPKDLSNLTTEKISTSNTNPIVSPPTSVKLTSQPTSKLLLYYCTLVSLTLIASIFFLPKTKETLLSTLLFLPTALYFIFEFFVHRPNQVSLVPHKPQLLTICIIFLVFFSFGTRKTIISEAASPAPPLSSPLSTITEPAVNAPQAKFVSIKITDGSNSVNIRRLPSIQAEKMTTAKDGDIFELAASEPDSGWFAIKLNGGSVGFILSAYTQLQEQSTQ